MSEIFLYEKDIPGRCDSCPFCHRRDNKDGTAKVDFVCLANNGSRSAMTTLPYTDTMHWRHDKCPIKSIEEHDKEQKTSTHPTIRVNIDKIFEADKGSFKAIASATVGEFAVHCIRVYENENGVFVRMPIVYSAGEPIDVFHPVSIEARQLFLNELVKEYERALDKEQNINSEENINGRYYN